MKTIRPILIIGFVVVLIAFANACGNNQRNRSTNTEQTNSKPQEVERVKTPEELLAEQKQRVQQQLVEEEQRQQQLLIEQKQILEKELHFFDKPFDAYSHCKTEASIQNLLGLFGAWAALIEARENSEDAGIQILAKQLRDKVVKCQAEAFPILRQEYPKVINNKIMVTHDKLGIIGGSDVDYVDMKVGGNKNTYATFTWWGLGSDTNKAIFQRKILDTLTILRFTKAKLWASDKYDLEPYYFTPFKGKDTDLVVL